MHLPNSETEHYQAAIEAMESCIGMLHHQAVIVSDEYLDYIDKNEGIMRGAKREGSGVQLSVTRRGNSLDIKWTGIRWYGPKNNRFTKRTAIPKQIEKQEYTVDKLKQHAADWELNMVMQTEEKMKRIRRKATHVVKGIMAIRNAIRVQNADGDAAHDFGMGDDEPQD